MKRGDKEMVKKENKWRGAMRKIEVKTQKTERKRCGEKERNGEEGEYIRRGRER